LTESKLYTNRKQNNYKYWNITLIKAWGISFVYVCVFLAHPQIQLAVKDVISSVKCRGWNSQVSK